MTYPLDSYLDTWDVIYLETVEQETIEKLQDLLKLSLNEFSSDQSFTDEKLVQRLGQIKNSKALKINSWGLKHIPESLVTLKELTKIDFFGCQIEEIPEFIGEMTNLEYLDLSNNPIEFITKKKFFGKDETSLQYISKLKNLKTLKLSRINCSNISKYITELKNLEVLHIPYSKISLIELNRILKLKNLKEINISNCSLKSIPSLLFMCKELTHIDLSYNQFKIDLTQFDIFEKLEYLNLSNLPVTDYSDKFYENKNLSVLFLKKCNLSDEFLKKLPGLENLTELDISDNFSILESTGLDKLKKMVSFSCNRTKINESTLLQIFNLPELQSLNLQSCGVEKLPRSRPICSRLTELNLSSNRLTDLDLEIISGFKELRVVKLSGNDEIRYLPESFRQLEKLEILYIIRLGGFRTDSDPVVLSLLERGVTVRF